jgi:flagellar FliL protein
MSVTKMAKDATPTETPAAGGRSARKSIAVLLVLLLTAGASWLYLKPSDADAAPVPGEVLKLEPIQLNLAEGRYLRVGIAIQGVASGHEELEGSKALDATIELFSGRKMEDLAQSAKREELKDKLRKELDKRYHGDVIDVYFTDFVTQ